MLTLDVDGQKIDVPWSRDEPPSKEEEDAIKERVRAALAGNEPDGSLTAHPIPPKSGAPVTDYSYSISVPIDHVDDFIDRIAKMPDPFAADIAAQLRELAVQIYQDPSILFDWEIHVDALVSVPRLKSVTVRVNIKPDGESG